MNHYFLLYSLIIYVGILISLFLIKKYLRIQYDRRTMMASTVAILWIAFTTFFISSEPFLTFKEGDNIVKSATLLIVVLGVNALVQFILWISYVMISSRNILKLPRFILNILAIIVVFIALLIGVKIIFDQELNGLLVSSTLVSAVIGLALQGTLSNLFAGFALQIESPFNIDDWVNLGGHEGKVVSQNWRSITLLTRENHRVSLTNTFVAEDKVVNYSKPTRRQVHNFYITLDYSHPPNKVKNILRELMNEIEEVDLDPTMGAFVVDYLDSGIKYCMKYWLHDYGDIIAIQDVVLTRLWYKLDRHHIKIPYPITEVQHVQLTAIGGEADSLDQNDVLSIVSKLDWLKGMQPDNIAKLVSNGTVLRYTKDDLVVRQDDKGDSMFVVIDGSVRVLLRTDHRRETYLADKVTGEFFGEMSLLTGELRSASIRANEDSLVLKIDQASFSSLIATDDEVLSEFVEVLSKSKNGIAEAIENTKSSGGVSEEVAIKVVLKKVWNYLKNPT